MGPSIYRIDNRTYARYNGINSRKGDFGKVKKGMPVLTLFVMLLALASPVLAEDVSGAGIWTEILVVGAWTPAVVESGGEMLAPAEFGLDFRMELLEDGSCVLTLNGRNELGTWVQYGANVAVWDANGMAQRFELAEDGSLRAALGEFDVALVRDVAAKVAENVAGGEKGM